MFAITAHPSPDPFQKRGDPANQASTPPYDLRSRGKSLPGRPRASKEIETERWHFDSVQVTQRGWRPMERRWLMVGGLIAGAGFVIGRAYT